MALSITLCWGCEANSIPTTPVQASNPSPPVPQTHLQVTGVVTDEHGAPIAGASVGLSHSVGGPAVQRTSTDVAGQYQFSFQQVNPMPIAVYASTNTGLNIQLLEWTGTSAVRNLRVRASKTITAGESIVMSIEPDSSLCSWEFGGSHDLVCEWFAIRLNGPATVVVRARSTDGGSIAPFVGGDNRGSSDTASIRIGLAQEIHVGINLAIPRSAAPQRYEVTTSLQP